MKKLYAVFLALTMLFPFAVPVTTTEAQTPTVCIRMNYQPTTLVHPPLLQNGRTLISAEDICNIFGAAQAYVDEYSMLVLAKDDTALLIPETKNWLYSYKTYWGDLGDQFQYLPYIPMHMFDFDVPTCRKNGILYLPLRTTSSALANGIDILWSEKDFTIDLLWYTDKLPGTPENVTTADKAAQAMRNLAASGRVLQYSQTTPEILMDLGIAKKEDFEKGHYLTTLEALHLLDGKYDPENSTSNLSYWYRTEAYAPLDDIDDSTKRLLLALSSPFGDRIILKPEETAQLKFDKYITEHEALIYITRMLGSTYGCTDVTDTLYYTEKAQTYQDACHMGLISDTNMENADNPITNETFLKLLHKALFVEYRQGGYGGVSIHRYIDAYTTPEEEEEDAEEEVIPPPLHEITTEVKIGDDLSMTWTLPESYSFIEKEEYWSTIECFTEDGVRVGSMVTSFLYTEIDPTWLVKHIAEAFPKKLSTIRCTYAPSYDYEGAPDEYYIEIDLKNIQIVATDEQIRPGTYTHYQRQWVIEKLTLAENTHFEAGCYYVLIGYEHTYRKPEYNTVARDAFFVSEDTTFFLPPTNRSYGVTSSDEIYIQKVKINGNAKSGFTLYISPISEQGFNIQEGSVKKYIF